MPFLTGSCSSRSAWLTTAHGGLSSRASPIPCPRAGMGRSASSLSCSGPSPQPLCAVLCAVLRAVLHGVYSAIVHQPTLVHPRAACSPGRQEHQHGPWKCFSRLHGLSGAWTDDVATAQARKFPSYSTIAPQLVNLLSEYDSIMFHGWNPEPAFLDRSVHPDSAAAQNPLSSARSLDSRRSPTRLCLLCHCALLPGQSLWRRAASSESTVSTEFADEKVPGGLGDAYRAMVGRRLVGEHTHGARRCNRNCGHLARH